MATGAIVARILTQYSDKGSKQAQKDIKKLGADFDKFAKQSFRAFGLATLAVGAFATKLGVDAVRGAMEDQKQQIALATALRNTTGATDEAIAATVKYLDKQELLVGVDNNQLIPSLQVLTQATRDVTQAQQLQNLALDISAGTSKDLGAVSLALAKALGGNVGALTRLGVPLDAAAVKSKDLNAILESLGLTFAGQAAKRAETFEFRLMRLQLAFNQVLDQIGYAFIPVLEEFSQNLLTNVIPAIQKWVDENKEGLVNSLRNATEFIKVLLERAIAFGQWVTDNTGKVKALAVIIGGMFVANKIAAFVVALKTITAAMAALRATAIGTAIATAFATAGVSVGTAAAALAAVGVTALVTKRYMDFNAKSTDKVTKATKNLTNTTKNSTGVTKSATTAITKYNFATGATTNTTKTLTAEQKKALEVQKQLNAEFGVTTKETDPIQLEAARLNLIKQQQLGYQAVDAAAWALFQTQVKINYEAERYKDIQLVIADQKLDNAEIDMLAKKWSISREAVIAYIASVTGAGGILGLDSPGNVAAIGWKNALDAYNKYLAALGGKPEVTKPAAESKAAVSIASAATVGVGAEAAQKTYESMISQGYDTTAALSSARYAGMAEQYAAYQNRAVAPTSGPVVGFTPTAQYGSTAAMGTPFGQAGSVTVNVNAGSVIGSTDALVNTVREGILASQLSGKIIQLEALNL